MRVCEFCGRVHLDVNDGGACRAAENRRQDLSSGGGRSHGRPASEEDADPNASGEAAGPAASPERRFPEGLVLRPSQFRIIPLAAKRDLILHEDLIVERAGPNLDEIFEFRPKAPAAPRPAGPTPQEAAERRAVEFARLMGDLKPLIGRRPPVDSTVYRLPPKEPDMSPADSAKAAAQPARIPMVKIPMVNNPTGEPAGADRPAREERDPLARIPRFQPAEACCPACEERPTLVETAKAKPAEACCPACEERPTLVEIAKAKPAEACCPACEERPTLVEMAKAKPAGACCPACEERGPLTAAAPVEEASGPSIKRLAVASALAVASEVGHFSGLPEWLTIALAAAAVIIGGISTWLAGWRSIGRLKLDIMALMSVAVTGAVLIGEFSEGALVLVLFALAESLEERSVDRARRAIASLLTLAPEKALVDDGSGKLVETRAAEVPLGSRIRVRPGEKLALDGVVTEGSSAIDQSPITGESVPVQKFAGDQVFAGTLNVSGVLDYEVTVPYGDSALARIVKTVEAAERAKAPVERFVERFARIYTPAVFVLAILAAILPPLLIGGEWRSWIYRALALLVISCPCALVVSTPVALLSAMASATRRGLLIKGGVHLEEGRRLAVVAMDKTGTLTSGRPSRTDIAALGGFEPAEADRLSASLASLSNHPVSKAVVKASAFKDGELAALTGFRDIPGLGIEAELGGRKLALGDSRLAKELGALDEDLEAAVRRLESEGKTATILVVDGKAAALLATADTIKEDSRRAVSELKALGVRTVMLTGDNELTAAAVAAQVGVDSFRARLMPEEKLAVIEELGSKVKVGMAGDGINDAPALARADVGFSMGAAGTGTAIETADVAIMDDNLAKIPLFIRLSRAVHRVLTGNIVFIMAVKLSFITVTLMGRADMWMAVLADIGVTLIVVANSMRLSRS